jgi:hypothetical protein
VLAGGSPTEMQLLGEGDEVAQLLQLHVGPLISAAAESRHRGRSLLVGARHDHHRGVV